VRSRHGDLRGDFARSERQQQVLLAIKAEASHLNVADLPALAKAFNGEIKTSMGLTRVRQLMSMAGEFDGSGIHRWCSSSIHIRRLGRRPGGRPADWGTILPLVHQSFP